MSPERLPGLLLVASLTAALASGLWRARRWRAGRPADVDLMRGLAALPKRYLVDVHAVVLRDPPGPREPRAGGGASARMHVLTAGGLVLATPLALLQGLTPLRGPWLAVGLLAALAMMAAGVALVAWRRWPARPARLSGGAFDTLPWALGGFVAFLLRATCSDLGVGPPVRWTALPDLGLAALGVWACAEIFTGVGWGPMRHALAGALHLAFHPRPARFDQAHIDAALRPLALDSPRLGVQSARDFRWNELLGFDACVQCGRCEAACPAFAAGQPLNPKTLIRDLASAATHGTLIGSGAIVEADTLWACTTCRACVSECPMMIEHVDAVVDLRRFQTLELGATPGKAVQALQELRATDTVCGFWRPAHRATCCCGWARRLSICAASARCVLWFKCCSGPRSTSRCWAPTSSTAATSRAGSVTRRPLRSSRAAMSRRWQSDALLVSGRLPVRGAALDGALTFHDPCYLGRYNGDIESPRQLLQAIGIVPVEMKRSGMRSSCCGWGGGAAFTDVPGKRRIPDVRIEHAREVAAQVVAVACPNCAVMLEGVVAPRPAVLDLAELVQRAVQEAERPAEQEVA